MQISSCFQRSLAAAVLCTLALPLAPSAHATSLQNKGGFRQWLQNLAAASSGGSVIGRWRGAKTENDPIHGGYANLSFLFVFSADGTYQETAYMGASPVMTASGSFEQNGNRVTFNPQQCSFANPQLGQVVKFFPIPTDGPAEDAIMFSPLAGSVQMSLKDATSGEDWGLKPA